MKELEVSKKLAAWNLYLIIWKLYYYYEINFIMEFTIIMDYIYMA